MVLKRAVYRLQIQYKTLPTVVEPTLCEAGLLTYLSEQVSCIYFLEDCVQHYWNNVYKISEVMLMLIYQGKVDMLYGQIKYERGRVNQDGDMVAPERLSYGHIECTATHRTI